MQNKTLATIALTLTFAALTPLAAQAQRRAPAGPAISGESTMRTETPRATNPTVGNTRGLKRMFNSFGSKRAPRGASKRAPL
ncbi:hypothetical protein GCM10007036_15110 [Alsobacter metallidurans]|uniref:Uncharacterized protein n=1 Tax=Alsobacter metallidurans TaxID=340221 RepID=A0A917I6K6_9HYPH|nr:hypothetical protein [Alsobacter metallidurans]GGH15245.1 hypothetical protein GCM10007036_15110 [Alsobacter metallidurans]